jgi:hypothetical protein
MTGKKWWVKPRPITKWGSYNFLKNFFWGGGDTICFNNCVPQLKKHRKVLWFLYRFLHFLNVFWYFQPSLYKKLAGWTKKYIKNFFQLSRISNFLDFWEKFSSLKIFIDRTEPRHIRICNIYFKVFCCIVCNISVLFIYLILSDLIVLLICVH